MSAIDAALAAGEIARAAALAEAALAAGERTPQLLNLAAWRRETAGDIDGALLLLTEALRLDPGDAMLHVGVASALRAAARFDDAVTAAARATALAPDAAAAWLERGYAEEAAGELRAAAASFAEAVRLDPGLAPAHAARASIAARLGDGDAARTAAAQALRSDPADARAIAALARVEIAAGEAGAAAARLRARLAGAMDPLDRIVALSLLGDACDRLDDRDAAVAAWRESKALSFATFRPRFGERPHVDFVGHLIAAVAAIPARAEAAPDPAAPIFLLGYPRSGTTLVETLLGGIDGVVTAEERPTLGAAARAYLLDAGGAARLFAADPAAIAALRADYWAQAARYGWRAEARAFVDMDPLKGLQWPLIARLFPGARVLLMRRDPRDVVWSCFRTAFAPTPAAMDFTTLAGAAAHYAATMDLLDLCRERLPLPLHELRYGALVEDADRAMAAVSRFAGLPAAATALLERTASAREIRTASAAQVRRGLYDGRGGWRRYAAWLEPVLGRLSDRIAAFGDS